jgi:hypothetical protein
MDPKVLFSMAGFSAKGIVRVVATRDGETIFDHTQPNLWLDEGTRRLGNSMRNGNAIPYVCLSTNTVLPKYTDTVIPNVVIANALWPSREDSYKRWKFQTTFLAPAVGTVRTVNTIGIATSGSGTSAYCYTVLTTPLVQDDKTTLTVFYYIYVTTSRQNYGYGTTVNWMLYWQLFRDGSRYSSYRLFDSILSNDIMPDESANTTLEWQWYGSTVGNVGDLSFDWTHLRYDTGIIGLGSKDNLGSWVGWGWKSISFDYFGPIKYFPFSTLGRVWGKRWRLTDGTATNPIDFYDLNNPTVGYMKAFQVRAKNYPFTPLDMNRAKFSLYIDAGENLYDIAGMSTALYWVQKEDWILRPAHHYYDTDWSNVVHAETLFGKFGSRDWVVFSTRYNWDERLFTCLENLDTGGGNIALPGSRKALYIVYDTVVDYFDRFFAIDARNNQRDIYSYVSGDGTVATLVETKVATAPYVAHHAIILDNKTMLIWHRNECLVSILDLVSYIFTPSWIHSPDLWLFSSGVVERSDGLCKYYSWGNYLADTDEIVLCQDSSMIIMERIGIQDRSQFNGIANFNAYTVNNWSLIQHRCGFFRMADSSLYIQPNGGNIGGTVFHPTFLAQRLRSGPFEVTMALKYDARHLNQRIGLVAIPTPTNNNYTHKSVLMNRVGTQMVAEALSTVSGVSTTDATAVVKSGLVNTSNLAITANGAYNSGNLSGPANAWTSNNDYWQVNSTGGYTQWKFNAPTVINKYALVNPTDRSGSYQLYSWTLSGSMDGTTWVTLDSVASQEWEPTTAGFTNYRYFNNVDAYSYYRLSAYDSFYHNPGSYPGCLSSIELHYEDPSVRTSNTLQVIHLKLTRDSANVVQAFYSLDELYVPDGDCTWTNIGTSTQTIAGDLYVGIAAFLKDQSHEKGYEFKVLDYRVNIGEVDKRVNYINLTTKVVNDCRRVSRAGSVIRTIDNYLHVIGQTKMVTIDPADFTILSQRPHVNNTSTRCGYFHDNPDQTFTSAFLFDNSTTTAYDEYQGSNNDSIKVDRIYVYEPTLVTWACQQYPLPLSSYNEGARMATGVINKKHIIAFGHGTWWSGNSYNDWKGYPNSHHEMDYSRYSWDTVYEKWVRVDWTSNMLTMRGRPVHADWQDMFDEIQIRCQPNPLNENLTFANTDRYEFGAVKNGFIKDNQQYLTGVRLVSYFADARQMFETYDLVTQSTQNVEPGDEYFTDSTGQVPNTSRWTTSGTAPLLTAGALQFTAGQTASCTSVYSLEGDFDIQIDVPSISNDGTTNWSGLRVVDVKTGYAIGVFLQNHRFTFYQWLASGSQVGTQVVTADTTTKFRLARSSNIFTGYYWNSTSSAWVSFSITTMQVWNDMRVNIYCSTPSTATRFNNFKINSGTVSWIPYTTIEARALHMDKWLRADFGGDSEFYFLDKSTGYHAYLTDYLLNQNISAVIDSGSIITDSTEVAKGYNFYLGNYLKWNGETRKIIAYDSTLKLFTCDPFSSTPSVGDKFSILSPASAVSITDIYSNTLQTNVVIFDELLGRIYFSRSDANKDFYMAYVYLLRSW